jgi:hypothetical protein
MPFKVSFEPGELSTPWTQNRYAYVGNNPIKMWDPTGNVPEWVGNESHISDREPIEDRNDALLGFKHIEWTLRGNPQFLDDKYIETYRDVIEGIDYIVHYYEHEYRYTYDKKEVISRTDYDAETPLNPQSFDKWVDHLELKSIADLSRIMEDAAGYPVKMLDPAFHEAASFTFHGNENISTNRPDLLDASSGILNEEINRVTKSKDSNQKIIFVNQSFSVQGGRKEVYAWPWKWVETTTAGIDVTSPKGSILTQKDLSTISITDPSGNKIELDFSNFAIKGVVNGDVRYNLGLNESLKINNLEPKTENSMVLDLLDPTSLPVDETGRYFKVYEKTSSIKNNDLLDMGYILGIEEIKIDVQYEIKSEIYVTKGYYFTGYALGATGTAILLRRIPVGGNNPVPPLIPIP